MYLTPTNIWANSPIPTPTHTRKMGLPFMLPQLVTGKITDYKPAI